MIDGTLRTETVSKLQNLALISLPMLRMMAITDGPKSGLFCRKVRAAAPGSLQQVGSSLCYTLIAWIGLLRCAAEKCLAGDFYSLSFARLYSLLRQEPRAFTLGELGLMLWLDSLANTNWASEIGSILNSRWPREKQRVDTMNVAWLLLGLSKNRHCAGRDRLMREALQFLTSAYNDSSGLFALDRPHWTRGLFGQKYRTVCGSFASQVYPIVALCEYAREYPGVNIVRMIRNCTDRICSLQGNSGEWWWIYDVRNSSVLADYPVYSVHQDAMGPMCLLAAMKIDLESDYTYAINKSLDCLFVLKDADGTGFVDYTYPTIWRALGRDLSPEDPGDLPFGLSHLEFERVKSMGPPLMASGPMGSSNCRSRILREARPYCPGWILLAYAEACDLLGGSVDCRVAPPGEP